MQVEGEYDLSENFETLDDELRLDNNYIEWCPKLIEVDT